MEILETNTELSALQILSIYPIIIIPKKEKTESKVYKRESTLKNIKLHNIFYSIGVLFIFASVLYFTSEFITGLPDPIKLMLLIVSVIITFFIGEMLRGADK